MANLGMLFPGGSHRLTAAFNCSKVKSPERQSAINLLSSSASFAATKGIRAVIFFGTDMLRQGFMESCVGGNLRGLDERKHTPGREIHGAC
jgi:hypothetical protein